MLVITIVANCEYLGMQLRQPFAWPFYTINHRAVKSAVVSYFV